MPESEIILKGISLERQISTATCWASVAAAIGNYGRDERAGYLSPATLIVAEKIKPDLRPNDIPSRMALSDAIAKLGMQYVSEKGAEERKIDEILATHFKKICVKTKVKGRQTAATEIIRQALENGKPLALGLKPTTPLIRKKDQMLVDFTHVVLCYGAKNLDKANITVLISDPANPLEPNSQRDFASLMLGINYINVNTAGPKFLEKYENKSVSLKIHSLIHEAF